METIKNEQERRKERIKKFKMTQLASALSDDAAVKDSMGGLDMNKKKEMKLRQIQEIDNYKQSKKQEVAKSVISEFMSEE